MAIAIGGAVYGATFTLESFARGRPRFRSMRASHGTLQVIQFLHLPIASTMWQRSLRLLHALQAARIRGMKGRFRLRLPEGKGCINASRSASAMDTSSDALSFNSSAPLDGTPASGTATAVDVLGMGG